MYLCFLHAYVLYVCIQYVQVSMFSKCTASSALPFYLGDQVVTAEVTAPPGTEDVGKPAYTYADAERNCVVMAVEIN